MLRAPTWASVGCGQLSNRSTSLNPRAEIEMVLKLEYRQRFPLLNELAAQYKNTAWGELCLCGREQERMMLGIGNCKSLVVKAIVEPQ